MPPPAGGPPAGGRLAPPAVTDPRDGVGPLDRRRPRVLLAVLVALVSLGGTAGAGHAQPLARPVDGVAILLALVSPAALVLLLPRWPHWAVLASVAATGTFLALGYPWSPVIGGSVIVLASVLLTGPARPARTTAWAGAVLLAGVVVADATVRADAPGPAGLLGGAAWAAVVLLVASGIRERATRIADARAAEARSRAERQTTAVAAERLRIAREMHDVLAHSLSAITVQAGVGLHLLDRDPEQARRALTNIRATSADALDEVRAVLGVVRAGADDGAAPLSPTWTVAALPRLVALAGTERLTASLDVAPEVRDLPDHLSGVVYRVVQEALTNVRRHAPEATRVEVRVTVERSGPGRTLTVTVDNDDAAASAGGHRSRGPGDGREVSTPRAAGVSDAEAHPGYGLLGMRERVEAVGGTIAAGPRRDGWRLQATLPWPSTAPPTVPGPEEAS